MGEAAERLATIAAEVWEANRNVAPDLDHSGSCEKHDSLNPHWSGWDRLADALAAYRASSPRPVEER